MAGGACTVSGLAYDAKQVTAIGVLRVSIRGTGMDDANNLIIGLMIGWVVASLGVYALADWKGKSGLLYFFFAIFVSPLIALIVVAVQSSSQEALDARALKRGDLKKCSNCGALSSYLSWKCDPCGEPFPKKAS